mgnify:CR=1 FL=1
MTRIEVHPDFRRSVLAPLERTGRALKRQVVLQGLCRCTAFVVAIAIVQFMLDLLLVLGIGPRAALLLVILVLVGREFWRYVMRPGMLRIQAGDVATLVERKNPALHDRLSSAVAFASAGQVEPRRDSPALVQALLDQTRGAMAGVRISDIFQTRRHRRYLLMGLCAAGLAALLSTAFPDLAATYVARNLVLRDVPWPSRVSLVLEGFVNDKLRWPIDDHLSLVATATDQVPPGVRAEFETPAGEMLVRQMARRGENQFVLDYGPLPHSLRVRFSTWRLGVDERTRWYTIEAVERPAVRSVTIEVAPPAYSGLEPFTLAAGQTSLDVLRGSSVTLRAEISKPVAEASLRTVSGVVTPADFENDRRVHASFTPSQSGTYYFDLKDADGLADTRPVTCALRLVNDPPPKVRLSLPGAGEMLTPSAILQVAVDAEDNLGIASADLLHAVVRGRDTTTPPVPTAEPLPDLVPRQTRYTLRQPWPLLPLTAQPGDQITIQARATDYQPPMAESSPADTSSSPATSAPANTGESALYVFRIVTAEEMAAELSRRENEWRREFEQIIKAQEMLNARVAELVSSSEANRASATTAMRLAQEERSQRQQVGRLRTVSRQFEQILAEMEVNQLMTAAARRRLDGGVIVPMRRLINTDVPAIAEQIEQLRQNYEPDSAAKVVSAQTELVRSMYAILANMLKWEGYDEAVSILRDIIRLQGDMNQDTQRRLQEELERLLGDEPPPDESGDQP